MPSNVREQTKELTDKLEAGIKELFDSDRYAEYLRTMSKFHGYSTRNTVLIHMQMPQATRVAGYSTWKDKFSRHVKKGEKGIRILAPTPIKRKEEVEKIDSNTGQPIFRNDGSVVTEEKEIVIPYFKPVCVFDISQTAGEPLPDIIDDLTGSVERYELMMDALRDVSPLPIRLEQLPDSVDGVCRYGDCIAIREGMSEIQTVCAVVHEISHAVLHDRTKQQETAITPEQAASVTPKDKATAEVESESISYVVCQHYNIETGANSFGYLAHWSSGRELAELKSSLDTIRKTAASLIDSIDTRVADLSKERGIDLTVQAERTQSVEQQERDTPAEPHVEPTVPADDVPPSEPALAPNQYIETIGGVDYVYTTVKPADVAPVAAHNGNTMPDPAIGLSERDLYGYTDNAVLPLLQERALELFDQDCTVYLLYEDNTEAMAFDREDIVNHDGIFGIEVEEWQRVIGVSINDTQEPEQPAPIDTRETALLHGEDSTFGIYQLKHDPSTRDYRFEGYATLTSRGLSVERSNYDLVYTEPLTPSDTLDNIFYRFNMDIPGGFVGHSLSVSDVVVLQKNGNVTSHYVDSFGFTELSSFIGVEKPATQAEHEQQSSNEQPKQSAPKRKKEMER